MSDDNYDASDFGSSDEHIPSFIDDDFMDELNPPINEDDLSDLEGYESDYLEITPDLDDMDAFQEMTIGDND